MDEKDDEKPLLLDLAKQKKKELKEAQPLTKVRPRLRLGHPRDNKMLQEIASMLASLKRRR